MLTGVLSTLKRTSAVVQRFKQLLNTPSNRDSRSEFSDIRRVVHMNGCRRFEARVEFDDEYLEHYERLFGRRVNDPFEKTFKALLFPEPSNPSDKRSVRVLVEKTLLGYLDKQKAVSVCQFLERSDKWGDTAIEVNALVRTGFYSSNFYVAPYELLLDFPGPDQIEIKGNGTYSVPVVGEASYRTNFEALFGERCSTGIKTECRATLVPEPSNKYDKNAVQVMIDNTLVGYLDRDSARRVVESLQRTNRIGAIVKVPALVKGGWYRGPDDQGEFGMWIDFPALAAPPQKSK